MENPRDHLEHEAQEHASGEHKIRLEKVAALEKQGIPVWPEAKSVDSTAHDVLANFKRMSSRFIYFSWSSACTQRTWQICLWPYPGSYRRHTNLS